jgi:outer membrane protein assembly factor BamD
VQSAATPEGISRDSVETLWTRAVAMHGKGEWVKASEMFERITLELPAADTLTLQARFRLGECRLAMGEQLQAAREFRKVSDETPNARLAPEALLRAGDAYAELWRRPELDPTYGQTALATYQELLNRYPDAAAADRAQLRIKGLQDDFAWKQFRAGEYYMRLKAYDSAVLYFKDLAATWPQADVTPTALLRLIDAYRKLDYPEDIADVCGYLRRFHAGHAGVNEACPIPRDSAQGS